MELKATLKRIFLRPDKAEINSIEDLFEPLPSEFVPKIGILDKIRAMPILAMFKRKQIQISTGMTVRQRVKRYNASMEGGHGIPEASGTK